MVLSAFHALTLSAGHQERQLVCKNLLHSSPDVSLEIAEESVASMEICWLKNKYV